jgi:hypothetical protein
MIENFKQYRLKHMLLIEFQKELSKMIIEYYSTSHNEETKTNIGHLKHRMVEVGKEMDDFERRHP